MEGSAPRGVEKKPRPRAKNTVRFRGATIVAPSFLLTFLSLARRPPRAGGRGGRGRAGRSLAGRTPSTRSRSHGDGCDVICMECWDVILVNPMHCSAGRRRVAVGQS